MVSSLLANFFLFITGREQGGRETGGNTAGPTPQPTLRVDSSILSTKMSVKEFNEPSVSQSIYDLARRVPDRVALVCRPRNWVDPYRETGVPQWATLSLAAVMTLLWLYHATYSIVTGIPRTLSQWIVKSCFSTLCLVSTLLHFLWNEPVAYRVARAKINKWKTPSWSYLTFAELSSAVDEVVS